MIAKNKKSDGWLTKVGKGDQEQEEKKEGNGLSVKTFSFQNEFLGRNL